SSSQLSLQRSSAPRDLHSFPTRRSSDLPLLEVGANRRECGHRLAGQDELENLDVAGLPGRHPIGRGRSVFQCRLRLRRTLQLQRDRKSTRLNSSHDQISYAVFCLKKKTK